MSALQIMASNLSLAVSTRDQLTTTAALSALQPEIRRARRDLISAMQGAGVSHLIAGNHFFQLVKSWVPVGSGYEVRFGLAILPLTDAERRIQADAAADRLDELRDIEAEVTACQAYAAAEGPQYASEFEHARF